MKLTVRHQESYSRGELLLRSFFGFLYIGFPHTFLLAFFGLWGSILGFIAFWSILFTGRYPESFFEYQVKLQRWSLRVNARMFNLCDDYPAFGLDSTDDHTSFEMEYPGEMSRGTLLLKTFFGWLYVLIPHGLALYLRYIASMFVSFLAWWVVLFTGSFPEGWHRFQVGTLRWAARVNLYIGNMTDEYPPFSGKE